MAVLYIRIFPAILQLRNPIKINSCRFPLFLQNYQFLQNYSYISEKSRENTGEITKAKYSTTATTKSTKLKYTTTFFTRTQHLSKLTAIRV